MFPVADGEDCVADVGRIEELVAAAGKPVEIIATVVCPVARA